MFQGSSNPSNVEGNKYHDFACAWALTPLSARLVCSVGCEAELDASVFAFFLVLRVLRGEIFEANSLDQEGAVALFSIMPVVGDEVPGGRMCCLPR